ncbi:MAG: hypothetical protein AB7L91_11505 [Dehalococcoidia bacterium]|nr:hypothetical protein [Nocardioidaceae bacterium]
MGLFGNKQAKNQDVDALRRALIDIGALLRSQQPGTNQFESVLQNAKVEAANAATRARAAGAGGAVEVVIQDLRQNTLAGDARAVFDGVLDGLVEHRR